MRNTNTAKQMRMDLVRWCENRKRHEKKENGGQDTQGNNKYKTAGKIETQEQVRKQRWNNIKGHMSK